MSVDIEVLKKIVVEAGELGRIYYGKVTKSLKADLSVVTEADTAIEDFLKLALRGLAPDYGFIGEESEEDRAPAPGEDHAWIVDALDGTRAFAARMPLWTPAVCLMKGSRPVAGAAINPLTGELFWADRDGPAFCNDEPMQPHFCSSLTANTFICGPTNHHRSFMIDFPGRVYCLGAPIYQFCLVAKGSVDGFFFDPSINLWDLALPFLLFERIGGTMVYESGRPVDLGELMDRRTVPEPVFAGGDEMVGIMRQRISYTGKR
ncbi:MAG: inositol monophosphatase [Xanthobacteraceae bacterium]|nr:MAG: inositol monophosphatase [Xanthobacteraceae bacterium]